MNYRAHNRGRIDLTRRTWSQRTLDIYQTLPSYVKDVQRISSFKLRLKRWIKTNIPLSEGGEDGAGTRVADM